MKRSAILPDQDRAPRREIPYLAHQAHLVPVHREASSDHRLGIERPTPGSPGSRHQEHGRPFQVVGEHFVRLGAPVARVAVSAGRKGLAIDGDALPGAVNVDAHVARGLGPRRRRASHDHPCEEKSSRHHGDSIRIQSARRDRRRKIRAAAAASDR